VNHTTIPRVFNEAMKTLWSDGVRFDVLLLVTDPTPHKKEAVHGLSVSCPKLIHVTRAVHALRNVCETIRVLDLHRDKLMVNVKKIFVKSPNGTELFKNKAPDTPSPPPHLH
jgi:hypothetical protein